MPNQLHLIRQLRVVSLTLVSILLLCSCARIGDFARRRADRAAYGIIASKQLAALDRQTSFSLEMDAEAPHRDWLEQVKRMNLADDAYTTPAYCLSLADALAIAMANNRDYRTLRERLFAQALNLADTRWDFGAIFSASASLEGTVEKTGDAGSGGLALERFGGERLVAGVTRKLATGARISLACTHDFIRYFTRDPRPQANNALAFQVVQPLLRGAGSLEALEELRQPERDMIYAVRDFTRAEQAFAIEVIDRYYDLLRGLDQLNNAYGNHQSALEQLNLLQIQVRYRTRSQLDADQALQQALIAETRWIDARSAYFAQVDQFKIFLGIELDLDLGPDRRELDLLQERGTIRPDLSLADAIATGLEKRLDLQNERDREVDAKRHVRIALRAFLPSLDARYAYATADTRERGLGLDFRRYNHTGGLDLGLPLDWTPRRDQYRRMLLASDRAERAVQRQHDGLIAEVRAGWRELEALRRKHEIAAQSVQLARRRVEGTQIMLAAGQTTAREMSDVQNEMLDAQNGLTAVLVDATLSRLRFWHSIGRLDIASDGGFQGVDQ